MTLLRIVQIGDPVLRESARHVEPGELAGLKTTIDALRDTMRAAPGVGLAAPQVGLGIRVAVIEDQPSRIAADPEARAKGREPLALTVLINPSYEPSGDDTADFYEGCLSMSGYRALVTRHSRVTARWTDIDGHDHEREFAGWPARIVQHEIDHLDGVLYVDRCLLRSLTTLDNMGEFWMDDDPAEIRRRLDPGSSRKQAHPDSP